MNKKTTYLDNPEKEREILFRFRARNEETLYRLASELKQKECRLHVECARLRNSWICVAARRFTPASESLNELCLEMIWLASQHGARFDGWRSGS